jgi:hypothetical protein
LLTDLQKRDLPVGHEEAAISFVEPPTPASSTVIEDVGGLVEQPRSDG